ncbi:hypothetical protein B6I21_08025 [candidate division KSB1 bacterium 4572_119]|nr:MAG: hypothetical protein B6I21_08025 [candidate division KSB1 bacterium 4572_119]
MIPAIDFYRPNTLAELFSKMNELKESGKIIAGGTDVIPGFQQNSVRFKKINSLVDINQIPELKTIKETDTTVTIGGAATFSEIMNSELIRKYYPLLVKAVSGIGSLQIRNRATVVGNFVNNAPCADSVPSLLVYDASIKIESSGQQRELLLKDFLLAPYRTQLNSNEVVTKIILPKIANEYHGDFYKLGRRRAVAISRITLAVLMKVNDSFIQDVRIASGAVTPIGKRFPDLEKFANGKKISPALFKELAQMMGEKIIEETGIRWSSHYKVPVVQQMFYQLLRNIHEIKE